VRAAGRIVRQLLVESTLLSLMGAACGIGLAWVSGRVLVDVISGDTLRVAFDLTPNWHVLAFTDGRRHRDRHRLRRGAGAAGHSGGPSPALRVDARMSRSRSRVCPSLVSAQVALSFVLLVGAGCSLARCRTCGGSILDSRARVCCSPTSRRSGRHCPRN
jgi:ABC-type antimicrobial peptide transport system permease subunit